MTAGHPQYVQGSVLFTESGWFVAPDGLIATLTIDTTGCTAGQTFSLKLAGTDIGAGSDFILTGDQTMEPAILTGTIEIGPQGDVDGDGHVDVVDLLWFVDAFGSVTGDANYDPCCDFNSDGSVDVVDLLTLVENFGT